MATTCLSTQSVLSTVVFIHEVDTFVHVIDVNGARQSVDDKLVHFVSVVVLRAEPCALRSSGQSYSLLDIVMRHDSLWTRSFAESVSKLCLCYYRHGPSRLDDLSKATQQDLACSSLLHS